MVQKIDFSCAISACLDNVKAMSRFAERLVLELKDSSFKTLSANFGQETMIIVNTVCDSVLAFVTFTEGSKIIHFDLQGQKATNLATIEEVITRLNQALKVVWLEQLVTKLRDHVDRLKLVVNKSTLSLGDTDGKICFSLADGMTHEFHINNENDPRAMLRGPVSEEEVLVYASQKV